MCDSIPKGIRTREFNRYVKNGAAQFKKFPGLYGEGTTPLCVANS